VSVVRIVSVERTVACRSDVGRLWDVITDTAYLNRASGLAPLALERIGDVGAARYRVRTRAGGFNVEWDERPFEWVYRKRFAVRRHMRAGPITQVDTSFTFASDGVGGTTVTLRLDFTPKLRLLAPMVRMGGRRALANLANVIEKADAAVAAGQPAPARPGEVMAEPLARAAALLKQSSPPEQVDRLVAFVRDGRDDQLSRIRAYELADQWGVDRRALLATCLGAVRAGLLELRWEVICPSCRTGSDSVPTLAALSQHGQCHMCDLSFGLDLDESVEATFTPARAVRKIDAGLYCLGGPARTPHVMAQVILPARGEAQLTAPDEAGRYRLFVRGGATVPVQTEAGAPPELIVDGATDAHLRLAPGGLLRVRSTWDDERHAKLERAQFPTQAATAREVTSMPGFRRDFSSEVLRVDVRLQVSRVALFFSDLTGSTQLYSDVGDAAALRLVQDHFDVVVKEIERHGGTLVKTIGDAVMAVFTDELDGMDASRAILEAWGPFASGHPHRAMTHIKLGLYAGPSYLVTANGVLDYFGQTVNIAARLQAQAASGELVVEAGLADLAVTSGRLPASSVRERYRATLKGVDQALDVVRIALA
jgi:adenylate cyclase